jgi:hypothetical protein
MFAPLSVSMQRTWDGDEDQPVSQLMPHALLNIWVSAVSDVDSLMQNMADFLLI